MSIYIYIYIYIRYYIGWMLVCCMSDLWTETTTYLESQHTPVCLFTTQFYGVIGLLVINGIVKFA